MKERSGILKSYLMGSLYAVVITLVLVLGLALLVRFAGVGGVSISVINQGIKVVSIFFGVGIATRAVAKRTYIHGAVFGIIYTGLAFLIFSLLSTSFDITLGFLWDSLFAVGIGAISAILLRATRRDI